MNLSLLTGQKITEPVTIDRPEDNCEPVTIDRPEGNCEPVTIDRPEDNCEPVEGQWMIV